LLGREWNAIKKKFSGVRLQRIYRELRPTHQELTAHNITPTHIFIQGGSSDVDTFGPQPESIQELIKNIMLKVDDLWPNSQKILGAILPRRRWDAVTLGSVQTINTMLSNMPRYWMGTGLALKLLDPFTKSQINNV